MNPVPAALAPLYVALEPVLAGDPDLGGLLKAVEAGRLAGRTPLPYLTFTVPSEGDFLLFGRGGSSGTLQLNIWTSNVADALVIWGHVRRLLNDQDLALVGHKQIHGRVTLVEILDDPDDDEVVHGVVRYEWTTLAA